MLRGRRAIARLRTATDGDGSARIYGTDMGRAAQSGPFGKVLVRIEGSMNRAQAQRMVRKLARVAACELVLDLALAEPLDGSGARALVDACRALGLIRVISFARLSDEESALLGEAGFACVHGVD